jgi:hypothetical protein
MFTHLNGLFEARGTSRYTITHAHIHTCTHTHTEPPAATYGDGVDGVGIAIIVAVVIVLAPITTGYHKDAPKALATSYHPMLQGSLRNKNVRLSIETLIERLPTSQVTLCSLSTKKRKKKQRRALGMGERDLEMGRELRVLEQCWMDILWLSDDRAGPGVESPAQDLREAPESFVPFLSPRTHAPWPSPG